MPEFRIDLKEVVTCDATVYAKDRAEAISMVKAAIENDTIEDYAIVERDSSGFTLAEEE